MAENPDLPKMRGTTTGVLIVWSPMAKLRERLLRFEFQLIVDAVGKDASLRLYSPGIRSRSAGWRRVIHE